LLLLLFLFSLLFLLLLLLLLQAPRDEHDFVPYNKGVAKKLQELRHEGYHLVVFSNQGGIKGAVEGKMVRKKQKKKKKKEKKRKKKKYVNEDVYIASSFVPGEKRMWLGGYCLS
jgi:hypothetical protein